MSRHSFFKAIFVAALWAGFLPLTEALAQNFSFKEIPAGGGTLALRNCRLFDGVRRVLITRRGARVELTQRFARKPYRLPRRYRYFACGPSTEGQTVLFAAQDPNGEVSQFTLGLANFPTKKNGEPPAATCKEFPGSIFKPCICAEQVPADIQYRPSLGACGGDAAAILKGRYATSFSVVLRDSQNRDRVPARGYNGCNDKEVEAGLNKCSAFKCQSTIRTNGQLICCFGEPGSSSIMAGATRMTLKLADHPGATTDPLLRVCLPGYDPTNNLN